MPDHPDLALLALRQVLLVVAALLGHVQVIVLHDDAEDDVAPFVHAIDDILVEVLILRRNIRRGSHFSSPCLMTTAPFQDSSFSSVAVDGRARRSPALTSARSPALYSLKRESSGTERGRGSAAEPSRADDGDDDDDDVNVDVDRSRVAQAHASRYNCILLHFVHFKP